jgi:hypothetical protein
MYVKVCEMFLRAKMTFIDKFSNSTEIARPHILFAVLVETSRKSFLERVHNVNFRYRLNKHIYALDWTYTTAQRPPW